MNFHMMNKTVPYYEVPASYIYIYMQTYRDFCRFLSIYVDFCRFLYIYVDLCRFMQIASVSHRNQDFVYAFDHSKGCFFQTINEKQHPAKIWAASNVEPCRATSSHVEPCRANRQKTSSHVEQRRANRQKTSSNVEQRRAIQRDAAFYSHFENNPQNDRKRTQILNICGKRMQSA